MDTELKTLKDLGFTSKEIDVYMVMLGLRSSSVFNIMSKAKVSRQSIYEILQKLLDKGLISYSIKNKKKEYYVTTPERLHSIIEEEQFNLDEKETGLQTLIPLLLKKYNENKETTIIENFVGKNGLKTMLDINLKVKKTIYILAGEGNLFETLSFHALKFHEKRAKLKIPAKILLSEKTKEKKLNIPLSETRYVSDKYNIPISIAIFGDHVNIMLFSKEPIGIHIENKDIADSFMNYFNIMWAIGNK